MFNPLNRRPQKTTPDVLGDDATRHHDEKLRLLDALKKLSESQVLIAADLPEGMFSDALTQLEILRAKRVRLDRSNLARVAKHASEAAINVGWTTYDIGDIARSTQSIASAIEEMSASISEVSQTSLSAGQSADCARTSMTSCMSDVDQAREAMKAIDARTHQIDERLRVLQGAIAEIGTMAGTIATISSQTNLLALNATIEAARAGEAGRGFAVVAAEVKSLSGQTAKSTEQIRTWLSTLQSEMGQIAQAVDESRGAVANGSRIVLSLGDRVEEASRHISQTSDMSQALAATLEQQRAATAEVSGSVQGIADKASKTHTEIENITKRLVKAETFAQDALNGEENGSPASELARLSADIGCWKRNAAQILVGFAPPERTAASLRGGVHRRAVELLNVQSPAGQAAVRRFLTADAAAHKEIDSMISAIAAGNWDVGTPAYKAACISMKEMEVAVQELLNCI